MSPKPLRLPLGQSDLRSPPPGVPPCRGVPKGERNTKKSLTKAVPEVGINSDSPKGSESSGFAEELSLCPPNKAQLFTGTPGCGEHRGENAAKSQEVTHKEQQRRGEGPSPQTQQQTRITTGELSITPQNEEGAAAKNTKSRQLELLRGIHSTEKSRQVSRTMENGGNKMKSLENPSWKGNFSRRGSW